MEKCNIADTCKAAGLDADEAASVVKFAAAQETYTKLSVDDLVKKALKKWIPGQDADSILRGIKSVVKSASQTASATMELLKEADIANDPDDLACWSALEKMAGPGPVVAKPPARRPVRPVVSDAENMLGGTGAPAAAAPARKPVTPSFGDRCSALKAQLLGGTAVFPKTGNVKMAWPWSKPDPFTTPPHYGYDPVSKEQALAMVRTLLSADRYSRYANSPADKVEPTMPFSHLFDDDHDRWEALYEVGDMADSDMPDEAINSLTTSIQDAADWLHKTRGTIVPQKRHWYSQSARPRDGGPVPVPVSPKTSNVKVAWPWGKKPTLPDDMKNTKFVNVSHGQTDRYGPEELKPAALSEPELDYLDSMWRGEEPMVDGDEMAARFAKDPLLQHILKLKPLGFTNALDASEAVLDASNSKPVTKKMSMVLAKVASDLIGKSRK